MTFFVFACENDRWEQEVAEPLSLLLIYYTLVCEQ